MRRCQAKPSQHKKRVPVLLALCATRASTSASLDREKLGQALGRPRKVFGVRFESERIEAKHRAYIEIGHDGADPGNPSTSAQ
jgi:hypothetical protein